MRSAFGETFEVSPGYLNTASVGIPPTPAADAVERAVLAWRTGDVDPRDGDGPVNTARAGWAALVGVPVERVASAASAAQLVAQVAAGVPDRTRVLVAEGEFTSVTFPFAAQAGRGVTVTAAPLAELPDRAPDYDLVAVSAVQSADGALADLAALKATGTRVLLDVSQAAGWLPLALDWADWVVGAGYKWQLSPRGTAWLAVRPEAADWTLPVAANWYAGDDPWTSIYDLPLRLAPDARAYDLSPVWLAQEGAARSLPWLAGLDMAAVHRHCTGLADALRTAAGLPPAGSAIVSVAREGLARELDRAGVRYGMRAGRARLGFHLYNDQDDLDRAVEALNSAKGHIPEAI